MMPLKVTAASDVSSFKRISIGLHSIVPILILQVVPFIAFLVVVGSQARAQYPPSVTLLDSVDNRPPTQFLTGRKLALQNEESLTITWGEIDLRTRVTRLARTQQAGIFLDRRIDSQFHRPVEFKDQTLESILWRLAGQAGGSVCRLDNLYYIGPAATVASLPDQIESAKADLKSRRSRMKVSWHRTVRYRCKGVSDIHTILKSVAQDHRFAIENLEVIPHDVWLGFELPTMPLSQLVQILAAGFDQTVVWSDDGSTIRFEKSQPPETIAKRLKLPKHLRTSQYAATARSCRRDLETLEVKQRGSSIDVRGPFEDVLEFESRLVAFQRPGKSSPSKRKRPGTEKEVFTLSEVTASRLDFFRTVASQLELRLDTNQAAPSALRERINVDVKNASIDELLDAIVKGSQLKASIEGTLLKVR